MAVSETRAPDDVETRYCVNHPDRATLVSCGRCGKPFCTQCLIHTPAGQRCYECAGVKRNYAQRATANRFLQALGAVVLGATLSSFIGFFGLIIAGAAGSYFGQTISPTVTRHTRPWIYVPIVLVLVGGAMIGFTLPVFARVLWRSGEPLVALAYLTVAPLILVSSGQFWLFVAIAGIVAYMRMR